MEHGDGHLMDMDGAMVMNNNTDKLPESCSKISGDTEITVHAGHKYSKKFPGTVYAYDKQEWHIKPCTRLTVHFINDDHVRHQWMVHGLPKYIYKSGMFHMEVTGPGRIDGTFILPANDQTYLVHCDMAQHMEKGLKAQLIVGKGGLPIPSVPGSTAPLFPDTYPTQAEMYPKEVAAVAAKKKAAATALKQVKNNGGSFFSVILLIGVVVGLLLTPILGQRYKGQSAGQVVSDIMGLIASTARRGLSFSKMLMDKIMNSISKPAA
ncbi:MAG TPA: copper oxidase [Crenotrichaceae bacterium]|nr:copper oxidase [Crenotrichaceae bacterium]